MFPRYKSSPVKPSPRAVNPHSVDPFPLAKKRKDQLRKTMHGYYLGPMDPSQFMSSFMPINSQSLGSPPAGIVSDFLRVFNQDNEKSMYDPFVDTVNAVCTNHEAAFTGDRADPEAFLKPDITLFLKNDPTGLRGETDAVTSFLHMELFIEIKHERKHDPFCDLPGGGMKERGSQDGDNTLGQCLLYAANQLAYQHRLFSFSLVVCGTIARFIRWDREGVVVSKRIDCLQNHGLVIEFLQRFNQLTAEQRGFDPTAVLAAPEEAELFESAVAEVDIEFLKQSVGAPDKFPRFRLEVCRSSKGVSLYVVGKALDHNLGIVGRCTRGYLALDLSTKKCVFLKDMWRPDVPGVEPEHVWYEKLNKAKVPHLVKLKHASDVVPFTPPIHYHGTVALEPTTTTSQEGAQRGLAGRLVCLFDSKPLQGHVHYRLVQEELCRSLSEIVNSKHLVSVVLDSVEACSSAFSYAEVFHRDASLGNVMIGPDGKGRLNDWDLCRSIYTNESLEGPRTGTWQFMSTRLLTDPGSGHTITDDLESHFFVLMWTALHWVKHNQAGQINMEFIFDQQLPAPDGTIEGGAGKEVMYGSKKRALRSVMFACKPFDGLFWDLWMLFADYLARRQRASRKEEPGPEPSVSPKEVIDLLKAALAQPGWVDDKIEDQFPRMGGRSGSGMRPPQMDSGPSHNITNQGKKRVLSNSLGDELQGASAKRQGPAER